MLSRDNEWQLGAATGGSDPLLRHAWGTDVRVGTETGRVGFDGFYQYDRFRPTFLLYLESKHDRQSRGRARHAGLNLRGSLPVRRTQRSVQSVSLTWRRERQSFASDRGPKAAPDLGGLEAAWALSSVKQYPYSISPVDGARLRVAVEKEDPTLGSDFSLEKVTADARGYWRFAGGGLVFAARTQGGFTLGEDALPAHLRGGRLSRQQPVRRAAHEPGGPARLSRRRLHRPELLRDEPRGAVSPWPSSSAASAACPSSSATSTARCSSTRPGPGRGPSGRRREDGSGRCPSAPTPTSATACPSPECWESPAASTTRARPACTSASASPSRAMRSGPGRFLALAIAAELVAPAAFGQPSASTEETVTLRFRDVPLVEVVHALFRVTGQGFVLDGDVLGHVDVELVDVSPGEVERALSQVGLALSGAGLLRRVTTGSELPSLHLSGVGDPISLDLRRPGDVRDLLRLFTDILGEPITAPPGPLGRICLFGAQLPSEDMLRATLASARLEFRRAGGRIVVWRRAEPDALLLPVSFSERHYGHVPHRAGAGSAPRPAGLQGVRAADLSFKGSVRQGSTWTAMVSTPTGLYDLRVGYRVFDGTVESVSGDVVRILREDGKRIEVRLSPAPPGISIVPEAAEQVVDRGAVLTDAGEFDAAEGVLRAALEAAEGADRDALSAALSDLHYAWGQARLLRHLVPDAIRHFESAYEIDVRARPWQAGEDQNEIGFAWTDIGEPERAVGPHRQALDIARTVDLSREPRPFTCVRTHPARRGSSRPPSMASPTPNGPAAASPPPKTST